MNSDPERSTRRTSPMPAAIAAELSPLRAERQENPFLFLFYRDSVRTIPLMQAVPLVIGRDRSADVQINDQSLSRKHARVCLVGEHIEVDDLGSTNGTFVAGKRITHATLALGEEVSLGHIVAFGYAPDKAKRETSPTHAVSSVENHDALLDALTAELVRARYFGRPLSLVTIRALDRDNTALRHVCARLSEALRPVDRLGLYSASSIEILLPEMDGAQAHTFLRGLLVRRAEEPPLGCGIASFPSLADTADKLLEASRTAAHASSLDKPIRLASEGQDRLWVEMPASKPPSAPPHQQPIANSKTMRAVLETAVRLGRSAIPVLLLGETGTGKEVIAHLIHDAGPRKDKPIVCVNCAAIPAQLVESTLFGHEKGSFTGAASQAKGVFEAADGGTVLLDEIGELPAAAQAALLRVLETRRFCRVGSTKEIAVSTRIIAATHRDLEAMAEQGSFRADLLYRLNTMTVRIPPLRERREDIEPLAARFLEMANRLNGTDVQQIAPSAMARLMTYTWPGNVRELRNAIERAVVIAEGNTVELHDLPERVRGAMLPSMIAHSSLADQEPISEPPSIALRSSHRPPTQASPQPNATPLTQHDLDLTLSFTDGDLRARLAQIEIAILMQTLRDAGGSLKEAARKLGLPLRTLQHKLKGYGIRRLGYGFPSAPTGTSDA